MDYESLGVLMTDSARHLLENRPKEAIALLKSGTLFKTVLNRAKQAQLQLFVTAETDVDRANLWSDLKWQTGLFPPEEPKIGEAAQKEARRWLRTMGGEATLLDAALKAANLGYNWNPSNRVTWEQENAEQQ